MKVILLEKINKLGSLGNIVNVKDGFARNFLLPQRKALRASLENIAYFEKQKEVLQKSNDESKKAAEVVLKKVDGIELVIIRSASDTGVLYGSVSTKDISDELKIKGFSVEKKDVVLNNTIKETGLYTLEVKLHPEVVAHVVVNVAKSLDDAKAIHEKPVSVEEKISAEAKAAQMALAQAEQEAEEMILEESSDEEDESEEEIEE